MHTPKWITDALTGPNNVTFAIGRVLGTLQFMGLVLWFPTLLAGVFFFQHVPPDVWFSFMDKLTLFVPAMALAAWAIIKGTASTEPSA